MADQELAGIRRLFIKRVSLPMIKELLDGLEEDKVLTADESASVIEENASRADRARSLVDMVIRKGKKASEKILAHLMIRDPELFSQLGLGEKILAHLMIRDPELFSQLGPVIPSSAQQSSRLVLCSEGFVEEKQKKNINAIYPVIDWSIRKRLALLITNIEFDDVTMKRKGAEKDEETMEELLKVLGYSVVKHRNLSAQDIDKAVKDFSQHPGLSQTDSVFVVIMSHGKLGAVLGVHWKFSDPEGSRDEFQNDNIFKHLNTQNCPALKDKPKVIIIQACRGEKKGTATWESDGLRDDKTPAMTSDTPSQPATDEEEFEDDALHSVHIEKDFISLLSSTPDNVSYRHSENGSLLIQFIADTINKHAHDLHIEDLFTKVMNCFEGFTQRRQMHSYKALLPFPRPLSAHPASIC